ncbi:MAG: hypothetical protein J6A25_04220 [Lachnospiraceae bacterium]|nr:hypothetical protein [Lachnospiraceae bacterium]
MKEMNKILSSVLVMGILLSKHNAVFAYDKISVSEFTYNLKQGLFGNENFYSNEKILNYDINGDDSYNIFDLCRVKKSILNGDSDFTTTNTIIADEQSTFDSNDYFSVDTNNIVTVKKDGYYQVVYLSYDGYCRTYVGGIERTYETIEEATDALFADKQFFKLAMGTELQRMVDGSTYYVLYSETGTEVTKAIKVIDEEDAKDPVPESACARLIYKLNEEATASRTDGAVVYTVRAKVDYKPFDSWDDTTFPDGSIPALDGVVCRSDKHENGTRSVARVEGFESGVGYDEFNLVFVSNDTYALYVRDTRGGYSYATLEITDVKTPDVPSGNPFENLDTKAPDLKIQIPVSSVADGDTVEVRITSDEPCVMMINGVSYGTTLEPITEAIFNAQYNGKYTVIASDIDSNTTQKTFNITNFPDSADEQNTNKNTGSDAVANGTNPYDSANRDTYWGSAELNNPFKKD